METRFLFPHRFKAIGWVLFGLALAAGIMVQLVGLGDYDWLTTKTFAIYSDGILDPNGGFFKIVVNDLMDELITIILIIGGTLVAFSKVKTEDEFSMKLRSESLIWAFYVSSAVNILITLFVFGGTYFTFLIYNLFFQLIFFVCRFHYVLYKSHKELSYEE